MGWFDYFQIAEWVLALVMVPVLVRRRLPSSTTLAWLAIIFLIPIVGVAAYLLVGDNRLGRKRVRLHREFLRAARAKPRLGRYDSLVYRAGQENTPSNPIIVQNERLFGMPILGGNHVELLTDIDGTLGRMIADIDAAQHHAHALFYIYDIDEAGKRFSDALVRAARRGVKVRLLADAAGSRLLFSRRGREMLAMLKSGGVDVRAALPVLAFRRSLARIDIRNHRKLLVIDGKVAFSGSHNVTDPRLVPATSRGAARKRIKWVDLSARFTGPVVAELQIVFLEDWAFETDETPDSPDILPPMERAGDVLAQTVPSGPNDECETFRRVFLAAINAARRKLIITTPYLIPDEPLMLALSMAAYRGVDVKIVLPKKSDHRLASWAARSYYDRLLSCGCRVYHYLPGVLHAKAMTIDDEFTLMGSANMDIRSFELNFELNVLMYGKPITAALESLQSSYIAASEAVDLKEWEKRPVLERYRDDTAALMSPLL